MRSFVAWLAVTSFVVEGALYCPVNYCLMQTATPSGADDAGAFSCEQYPVAEYTCDYEAGPTECKCNGEVRYGNYARMSSGTLLPEIWTSPKSVTGQIACTNDVFTNVVNGAKICTCTPTLAYTPVRDTKPVLTYWGDGYWEPSCVIQKLGLDAALPLDGLWGYGLNKGQVSLAFSNLFGMGTGMVGFSDRVTMRDFDYNTYVSTVQFDGLSMSAYEATVQLNSWRSDNSQLKTALVNFFDASGEKLGDATTIGLLKSATMGPLVLPRSWVAAVWCPATYCLNPVRPGTSSASFTCERFPETALICAGEGLGNCACDGVVKYGNWDRYDLGVYKQESWINKTVSGSIACDNDAFPGGISRTKYCTCTPSASTSYTRSSMPALDKDPGFTVPSSVTYQAPTCLTVAVEMTSSLNKATMQQEGVNRGLVDYFASASLHQIDMHNYASSGYSIIQEWNASTTTILAQYQGDSSFDPATWAATMLTESFGATMTSVVQQVAAQGGSDTAALASAGVGYSFGYGPLPKMALHSTVVSPSTYTGTTTTSTASQAANALINLGSSGCSSSKPCGPCEGDCDSDSQCMAGTECYQRSFSSDTVPGCASGGAGDIGTWDYCYTVTTTTEAPNALQNLGTSGCSSSGPCGPCQGDCDDDSECAVGSKCLQRNSGTTSIPGCVSGGAGDSSAFDYCYEARSFLKTAVADGIPNGWRLATKDEVEKYLSIVNPLLEQWDIAKLANNTQLGGSGYNNEIKDYQTSVADQIITTVDGYQAPYETLTSGSCPVAITSLSECSFAAAVVMLADTTASDDGQSSGTSVDPPYCYYEGNRLKYNSGSNYGSCSSSDVCVCKKANGTITTTAPTTTEAQVSGAITFTVDDPALILNNATVKQKFEENVQMALASLLGLIANAISVTASAGRRLSSELRRLAGNIRVDYTIASSSAQGATVLSNVESLVGSESAVTTLVQGAINSIDPAICSTCATTSVSNVVNTVAPTLSSTLSTQTLSTQTSGTDSDDKDWWKDGVQVPLVAFIITAAVVGAAVLAVVLCFLGRKCKTCYQRRKWG